MSLGTVCLIAVSLLVLAALVRFFGILFIMMMVIDSRVNSAPYDRAPVKLRFVKTAVVKPFCPPRETCADAEYKKVLPA